MLEPACPEWGFSHSGRPSRLQVPHARPPGHHQPRVGKPGFLDLTASVRSLRAGACLSGGGHSMVSQNCEGRGSWRVAGDDMGSGGRGGVPVP